MVVVVVVVVVKTARRMELAVLSPEIQEFWRLSGVGWAAWRGATVPPISPQVRSKAANPVLAGSGTSKMDFTWSTLNWMRLGAPLLLA